ncbi:HNH endonuclease signature motif containing protein [Flavivirga abyssicola]|uniref:HNH endonuclease signature motif containing protein n=1 Tax=Flavivirga abyssicola TaxID=3063533 RepID=UPI0026DFE23D|nr:HNH endonuclease signature motif containing protein [Flavivirga sp. MEBiC07777]WVK14295.1 HNH endonuclease signature motif containing protein [Flavivirga sp. MEBiC07777]
MARKVNTNRNGGNWSGSQKLAVWKKGKIIPGLDSDTWRNDDCRKKMKWDDHGDRNSSYGWEIDHIDPVSNGGSDHIDNLQPLHWENNADKADKLYWTCPK